MSDSNRDITIDLIKAIAIYGVLVIHVAAAVLTQEQVSSGQWNGALLWGSLARGSVPLFLMASGAIMLDPMKKISLKKLYFHNIARIVAAMLVWGFCYKLYHLFVDDQLTLFNIWHSFKRLLLLDQEFHFYYIHIILLVYAFLPITRNFAEKASKKTIEYALCIWIVLAIVYPTLRNFAPFTLITGIPVQWMINLTYASIGYGLLGYYLKKYPLTFIKGLFCACVGFFITFFMTYYLSIQTSKLNDIFLQGTSVGVFLLAVGIFSISGFIRFKAKTEKRIIFLSKASFCIYLSHMFILYILAHFDITAKMLPTVFSVPIISGIVLLICLCIYLIIEKIPFLNKWII